LREKNHKIQEEQVERDKEARKAELEKKKKNEG